MSKRKNTAITKPIPAPPDLVARIRALQQRATMQLRRDVGLLVQGAASAMVVPKEWVFDDAGMVFRPRPKDKK